MVCYKFHNSKFLVNLYEIFRISVSWYEEHLWKISLQGILLAFIHINPHPAYSIEWRIYAPFHTLCIWTHDAYVHHSAKKMLNARWITGFLTMLVCCFFSRGKMLLTCSTGCVLHPTCSFFKRLIKVEHISQ